jgi:hypothetical protein
MRLNRKFAVLALSSAAAACGGGTNNPIIIDSPPEVDSPPAVTCPAPALGGLTLTGSMPFDAFITPTMPPNMGMKSFLVGARLPPELNPSGNDALFIEAVLPVAPNVAVNFTSNANPMIDYNPKGASYVFGNLTMGGADSLLWSTNGSVTFTMFGETDGSMIIGTVAATNYREVDPAGADVAGGCTTSLDELMFTLTQMDDGMAFTNSGVFSRHEMESAARLISENRTAITKK